MDDGNESNGLSGWAGFMLGRMAEQEAVSNAAFSRKLRARFRGEVPVDVSSLQNEIWRLRNVVATKDRDIAELNNHIRGMEHNFDRLNEWSIWAEQRIVELKNKLRDHGFI